MTPDRLHWLDLVRGFSAILVCAGHIRLALFVGYEDLHNPTIAETIFYIVTGLSSQAVIVFFVLSGYLVGGSVLRQGPAFRIRHYLTARLVRLWVVLIPALVFTLFVDQITLGTDPGMRDGTHFHRWTSGPTTDGSYSLSAVTFLGNIAFLQTIVVPYYGSNGPLWSLACEFWYYVLFPLLALAAGVIGPRRSWLFRAGCLALAVGILAVLPKSMGWGFVIWLMGVLASVISRGPLVIGLVAFLAALVTSKLDHYGIVLPLPDRFLVGVGFALLCPSLAASPMPSALLRWLATATAAISYSLYLVHFPVVVWFATRWYAGEELTLTVANAAIFTGWLLVLIATGTACWWLFERHTDRIRRLIV